eukprot:944075-Pleurochrysis_carterae.AAC.1
MHIAVQDHSLRVKIRFFSSPCKRVCTPQRLLRMDSLAVGCVADVHLEVVEHDARVELRGQ